MTDIDRLIAEVEAHDVKATKGPWDAFVSLGADRAGRRCSTIAVGAGTKDNGQRREIVGWPGFDTSDIRSHLTRGDNAALIAHYRTAAPALAAELKALRAAVRALLVPVNVYEATKAHIAEHWSELLDTDAMVKNALGKDSRLTVEKFAADAVGGVVYAKLAALVGWEGGGDD